MVLAHTSLLDPSGLLDAVVPKKEMKKNILHMADM